MTISIRVKVYLPVSLQWFAQPVTGCIHLFLAVDNQYNGLN